MPYFVYKGIDVYGNIVRGKKILPSLEHLKNILFNEGIALLSAKQRRFFNIRFIKEKQKIAFYKNLSTLLSAGILLPDALEHIALNTPQVYLQNILYECSQKVLAGINFSSVLCQNTLLAPPTIHFMIDAGQKSSNVSRVCLAVAHYFERTNTFKKNLLRILIMPIITCIIAIILFGIIAHTMVPRLIEIVHMFKTKGSNLEDRFIFKLLNFFTFNTFLIISGFLIVFSLLILGVYKFEKGRTILHTIVTYIPFFGTFIMQSSLSQMFFSLGLLLQSGVPLHNALYCLSEYTQFIPLKKKLIKIHEAITHGIMFSTAIANFLSKEAGDAALIIRIAEKTGTLGETCLSLGENYNETLKTTLQQLTTFLQPALILLLGIFIALIMIALYTPLIEFSLTI